MVSLHARTIKVMRRPAPERFEPASRTILGVYDAGVDVYAGDVIELAVYLSRPAVDGLQLVAESSNPGVGVVWASSSVPAGQHWAAIRVETRSPGETTISIRAGLGAVATYWLNVLDPLAMGR